MQAIKGKKVLLAVCGSIAAYKAAYIVRLLIKSGAEVRCILTKDATNFIAPLTLATLSKNDCLVEFTNANKTNWTNHVDVALWADVMLIAPASANTIAKMAHGICDNLLLATYLSAKCKVFVAPAMDVDMWHHPSTQNNISLLKSYQNEVIQVNHGELASGLIGEGRLEEPENIVAILNQYFENFTTKPISILNNKKILITAGPTYEPIDPVRFIGNHSSGKMGIALAKQASARGAKVTLVLGPSTIAVDDATINLISVQTAAEMYKACSDNFATQDVCIFAAAVADYKVQEVADEKIKKSSNNLEIALTKNVDIALEFGKIKKNNQISVGFALETQNLEQYAKEKLQKKNFDFVVLNSPKDKGAAFKHNTNKITILDKYNNLTNFELKDKTEVANDILNYLEKMYEA
ncbi:MAG: bifunctional phosphopantothenoylcysteine decarboxylase/phosphopantothenate--cysteine ligase CoaBC [Chitinophagales bacterium]|nr:bifunctional phosphopantothenoylcysteine decarboxylase/phosphopantothenate--cysteine ligase CoaBC [Chitinophagales bacterium]